MRLYPWLYRKFIHYTNPEKISHLVILGIGEAGRIGLTRRSMSATLGYTRAAHRKVERDFSPRAPHIGNRRLTGRIGLAAGLDKDARAILGMTALGFAFVEIGTITPLPQPGNDKPRLWRLMDQQGLRNRMGFNNEGADVVAQRLRTLRSTRAGRQTVVGANIGKNKITSAEDAPNDYFICAKKVARWVDFIVVNVSSPNTPGLRDLQAIEQLRPILEAARKGCKAAIDRPIPLFVKIAPDLADEQILEVAELTRDMKLDGVVATNTTIAHDLGEGGVSGAPLFSRAHQVVSLLGSALSDDQTLIATGGVFTPEDAEKMIDAGADLVEAYTAFVWEGPCWPGRMNRAVRG